MMNTAQKSNFFEREIQLIQSEDYRDFVRYFFNTQVGKWFWQSGASSTGRYHPEFTKGEGGLVRHTRAVAMICEELLRLNSYAYMSENFKDYARIACLLHDTCKYGMNDEMDKNCYADHGALAAKKVAYAWEDFFGESAPELLCMAIRSHMGQWVEDKNFRPFTTIDRLVHLSDYIASRSFFDIPQITTEYEHDYYTAMGIEDIDTLPF